MKMYTVTADVTSEQYGKGQLEAQLNETEFIEYANLSDRDKLTFLKEKGAQFKADFVDELSESDVSNFKIERLIDSKATEASLHTSRKMRLNINGRDTGWVEVTDENEAQYNEMMEYFNKMQEQFDQRFHTFFNFGPSRFLGLRPSHSLENKTDSE